MDSVLIVLLTLGFASLAHCLAVEYNQHNIDEYASDDDAEWERFKTTHSKKYDLTEEEEKRRMIFMNNLKETREHNAKFESGEVTYLQGINQFSDMTPDEVPKGLAPVGGDLGAIFYQPPPDVTVPEEVDWRTKGVVTDVKNQYPCGTCWAFSTTGVLEGQIAIKYKRLVSLSEQDLVDCDFYDGGCRKGGWPWNAYKYISQYGINSEESYPYMGFKGECRSNQKSIAAIDKGWRQVPRNEVDLKIAVATIGPISVLIDVREDLKHYAQGIYTSSKCSSDPSRANHAALVVGYGTTEYGEDYWLVKNSWGTSFGEEGYFRMARNYNMCGIANSATFPIV